MVVTDATVVVTLHPHCSRRCPNPRDCDVLSSSIKMSAFISNGLLLASPMKLTQASKDVAESSATQFMSNGLLDGPVVPSAEFAIEDVETPPQELIYTTPIAVPPLDASIASSSSFVSNGLLSAVTPGS